MFELFELGGGVSLFTQLPRSGLLRNLYAANCIGGSGSARIGVISVPSYARGEARCWGLHKDVARGN